MRRSARMISASLLMGLGMTVSGASVSAKPVQESQQPKTAAPQENAGKGSSPANPTPRPNPDASGIYHVGNGVTDPQVIYSVDPELTDKARKKKISGTCTIGLVVDIKGNPQDVHLVKSIAETVPPKLRPDAQSLDEKAVEAVKQYKFKPGVFQGKAVPVGTTLEINFRIY
jgi:TonB family protein